MQPPFFLRATLGALLCAGAILFAPKGWSQAPVEPVRCLVYTPDDIAAVRHAVAVDPVMRAAADEFLRRSDRWVKMSERQILDLMPAPDAEYAAGYAGDPETNGVVVTLGPGRRRLLAGTPRGSEIAVYGGYLRHPKTRRALL